MKNREIVITTLVFFLIVETNYYWEGKLGLFAFPVFSLVVIIYLILAVVLLRQLYLAFKEKFKQRSRLKVIILMATVLLLTFYKPLGLIDFDRLEGNDVLVASREGSANCLTMLKLKDDFTFRERIGCFGVTETRGTFKVVQDTIYFDNVKAGRGKDEFYQFAVIKPAKPNNLEVFGRMVMYKSISDTDEYELYITKIELQSLDDSGRSANRLRQ